MENLFLNLADIILYVASLSMNFRVSNTEISLNQYDDLMAICGGFTTLGS